MKLLAILFLLNTSVPSHAQNFYAFEEMPGDSQQYFYSQLDNALKGGQSYFEELKERQNFKIVSRCTPVAQNKLVDFFQYHGCHPIQESFIVNSIDNRLLNPSAYVWYYMQARCELKDGQIQFIEKQVLAQYYLGRCY
ncbi:MAG: hypothetical protein IPM57_06240 [Oligoflexia bacterium]|nr:hypothetical protein [Oligoflexia bacterium]